MATWTEITNGQVDQDSPTDQPLMTALRDNPVAISEGAAGAPRILDAALDTTVTTAGRNWVRNRVADNGVGQVGSYALLEQDAALAQTDTQGQTRSGANLSYSSADAAFTNGTPSGTWMLMGVSRRNGGTSSVSLWLRIS